MRCIIYFQNFISLRRLDAKDIKQSSYENIARMSNAVPVTLYLMVPKNVELSEMQKIRHIFFSIFF